MISVLHVVDILKSKKVLPHGGYDSNVALVLHWEHLFHILLWGAQQQWLCLINLGTCSAWPRVSHRIDLNRCKYHLLRNCKLLSTILFPAFLLPYLNSFLPSSQESYHLIDKLNVLLGVCLNSLLPTLSFPLPLLIISVWDYVIQFKGIMTYCFNSTRSGK